MYQDHTVLVVAPAYNEEKLIGLGMSYIPGMSFIPVIEMMLSRMGRLRWCVGYQDPLGE